MGCLKHDGTGLFNIFKYGQHSTVTGFKVKPEAKEATAI